MRHPFLEQTYLNIAIFNRSMKKYADSLMMWKRLEALQKDLYGEDNRILIFTWKNIGTCYLGTGQMEASKKCFEDCINLIQSQQKPTDKLEFVEKDKLEIAQLHQNLYLTYVSDRNYEKGLESSKACIAIMEEMFGPKSKRLASKHY